jgi:hypothetical protein
MTSIKQNNPNNPNNPSNAIIKTLSVGRKAEDVLRLEGGADHQRSGSQGGRRKTFSACLPSSGAERKPYYLLNLLN